MQDFGLLDAAIAHMRSPVLIEKPTLIMKFAPQSQFCSYFFPRSRLGTELALVLLFVINGMRVLRTERIEFRFGDRRVELSLADGDRSHVLFETGFRKNSN